MFKEMADKIRHKVDIEHHTKVHPDALHLHATALGVAAELGVDPTYFNIGHLMPILAQHVVAPSREFPKHKYHHASKREHIVHSAEEEHKLGNEWADHRWIDEKDRMHDHA